MSKEDQIVKRAESELDRLLCWVRAAETRISLILPLSTAMLGSLAVLVPPVSQWGVGGGITTLFAVVLLFMSIFFAALASFPRTEGPKGSLIYFGGIVTKDLVQYEALFKSNNQEEYIHDLLAQCHRNAQIADQKYTWIKRSMGCLLLAALPWGIALFILYSGKK